MNQYNGANVTVFGSNLQGVHGAGAALDAHRAGYPWGLGSGIDLSGWYAIPTRRLDLHGSMETLDLQTIKQYVNQFVMFSWLVGKFDYKVTAIGTGHAGYDHGDIAPLFKEAGSNVHFDERWRPYLGLGRTYWGTF